MPSYSKAIAFLALTATCTSARLYTPEVRQTSVYTMKMVPILLMSMFRFAITGGK